jgi:endonuclease/exonuclease/phosphatase family metal-dependent hydrolase
MPKSYRMHLRFVAATVLAVLFFGPASAAEKAAVKVLTYNIFQGTDFVEVLSAQTAEQFLAASQLTLQEVIDSKLPLRMQAIAHEIAETQPDLVGLEEATLWRYGIGPNPTDVLFDPLQELLHVLNKGGQHYTAVVIADEYELQGPLPDLMHYLRANGRNVILARTGRHAMHLSNRQSGAFHTLLKIPSQILGDLTIVRSWGSVDVEFHDESFRFIVTHLENPLPQIPESYLLLQAQAKELSDVPANTSMPVILAGDFNAIANQLTDPSNATYQEMLNLGFDDSWADVHPQWLGLTWPLENSSRVNTASQRIDFVFHRGDVKAREAWLEGNQWYDRVDGMWPSDHAGLGALLQVSGR